jgi:hypothetical protein
VNIWDFFPEIFKTSKCQILEISKTGSMEPVLQTDFLGWIDPFSHPYMGEKYGSVNKGPIGPTRPLVSSQGPHGSKRGDRSSPTHLRQANLHDCSCRPVFTLAARVVSINVMCVRRHQRPAASAQRPF